LKREASDLERVGAALGADVPFCVTGGTVRGSGIGDILTPLPSLPAWEVLILHPHVCVETGKAYDLFDKAGSVSFVDVGEMVDSVRSASFEGICRAMGNTFESFIVPLVPEVSECKEALSRLGLNPLMSGSGPTVFALVPPERDGSFFAKRLEKEMKNTDVMLTSLI
ncbi:MAG: 4-(cytidine 5'-diphospho)-2-C-methyl-D-erythritol kinase, partial [Megasphaera micronuciformis]|nr:4-(cytidine 5'-diphospho)-2-C-methyl-D-erythritol kinase [Megasphaera micronuciformis]